MAETRRAGFFLDTVFRLKRLNDHQYDDQNHQNRRHFIDDSPMFGRAHIAVFSKKSGRLGEVAVQAGHQHDQQQFCMQPATPETEDFPSHPETGDPVTIMAGLMMKRSNRFSITLKVSDVSEPGFAAQ